MSVLSFPCDPSILSKTIAPSQQPLLSFPSSVRTSQRITFLFLPPFLPQSFVLGRDSLYVIHQMSGWKEGEAMEGVGEGGVDLQHLHGL